MSATISFVEFQVVGIATHVGVRYNSSAFGATKEVHFGSTKNGVYQAAGYPWDLSDKLGAYFGKLSIPEVRTIASREFADVREAEAYWQAILDFSVDLGLANINYSIVPSPLNNAANSNSAAALVMEILGIDPNKLNTVLIAPGFRTDLTAKGIKSPEYYKKLAEAILKSMVPIPTPAPRNAECFPAGTPISLPDGSSLPIERICVGDVVLAFDPDANHGRGELRPSKVARLYQNTTNEWIRLHWAEGGEAKELVVTPGHHFLSKSGKFLQISSMLEHGRTTIVLASGELLEVAADRILHSPASAYLYEEAEMLVTRTEGGLAVKPEWKKGWKTYNFEVDKYHTYIAGGIRVHNISDSWAHDPSGLNLDNAAQSATAIGINGKAYSLDYSVVNATYQNMPEGLRHNPGTAVDLTAYGSGGLGWFSQSAAVRGVAARQGILGSPMGETYVNAIIGQQRIAEKLGIQIGPYDPNVVGDLLGGSGGSRETNDQHIDSYEKAVESHLGSNDFARSNSAWGKGANPGALSPEGKAAAAAKSALGSGPDGGAGPKPILIDLDGNGVQIAPADENFVLFDTDDTGLFHNTAWAGAGDAVLFFDPDGRDTITETRQYIFTEWDPTAAGDMEALRSVFDTNGDGKLSSADDDFAKFKLMVTNADGSTSVVTLAAAGITEIDLVPDATYIEMPDGSVITGQASYTKSDGSTGIVANATLARDGMAYAVVQEVSTDGSGNRTVDTKAFSAAGDLAFEVVSVTSADGSSIVTRYDDNGDGVTDRIRTIDTVIDGSGVKTETQIDRVGSDIGTAVVSGREVTVTSADGLVVTISRDSTGGGWFDEREVRTTNGDGSRTLEFDQLAEDGSVIASSLQTISIDGLTREIDKDLDGDGDTDLTTTHAVTLGSGGERTDAVTVRNGDDSLRSTATMETSADGKVRVSTSDLDGDGDIDLKEETEIVVAVDGSTTTTSEVRNGDDSLRSSTTITQSADTLTSTEAVDADGDGDIDATTVSVTTIDGSGRTLAVTTTNNDGSVRAKSETHYGVDQVSMEQRVDLNQDGTFQTTDLVASVEVDSITGLRTSNAWTRNPDGTIVAHTLTETSEDGLTRTVTIDSDGDSDADTVISDVTAVDGYGVSTRTIVTSNGDNSTRDRTVIVTSADGLTRVTSSDIDGDGDYESIVTQTIVLNVDDSVTTTVSETAGDGTTLLSQTVSEQSADRLTQTVSEDANGDGHVDRVTNSVEAADGSVTQTVSEYLPDGSLVSRTVSTISANGLVSVSTSDLDGNGIDETVTTDTTLYNADGSLTRTIEVDNGNGLDRSLTVTTTSDDGLVTVTQSDSDGDGHFERETTSTTVLNANGSTTETIVVRAEDDTVLSRTQRIISDDGLIVTEKSDADGDGDYDLTSVSTTTLGADGSTTTVTELRDAESVLRNSASATVSDNGRERTQSSDVNGDGEADTVSVLSIADDGTRTETTSEFDADGSLQSRTVTITSDDGLSVTTSMDFDGDGTFDRIVEETTVLGSDGSVTKITQQKGRDGSVFASMVSETSADGLSSTVSEDSDGDGTDDRVVVSSRTIAANGVETRTSAVMAANGSAIETRSIVTSADGRTVTDTLDSDGNGTADSVSVSVQADDGTVTQTSTFYSAGGGVEGVHVATSSGDGLYTTLSRDGDGDGLADITVSERISLGANGEVGRSVEYYNGRFVTLGAEEYLSSDDGLSQSASYDLDGDGLFEFVSTDTTTYEADGSVVRDQVTRDASSNKVGEIASFTSGDGMSAWVKVDYSGDGTFDRVVDAEAFAGGGSVTTSSEYHAGYDLLRQTVVTVSADGRTRSSELDSDGDGYLEHRSVETVDLDRGSQTVFEDFDASGVYEGGVTVSSTANGAHTERAVDIDGDGDVDYVWQETLSHQADGSEVRTVNELYGGRVGYSEITTTDGSGQISVTQVDLDGDGVVDSTSTETTVLNGDGSQNTTTEIRYANGDLRFSSEQTLDVDGRTFTESIDFDGNGIADTVRTVTIQADGERLETETSFNESGVAGNTFITRTSADGLVTTIVRAGNEQTITRSPVDENSYDWDNGVTASLTETSIQTSHEVDAFGFETWSATKTWQYEYQEQVTVGTGQDTTYEYVTQTATDTESATVRLDPDAKSRLMAEAARIYDTVFDRDLDFDEYEALVFFVEDGQLDKSALISSLLTSGEFSVRYGTLSDAEAITRLYVNTYGRAPGLEELDVSLRKLSGGSSLTEIALDLAESSEHLVFANQHLATNLVEVAVDTHLNTFAPIGGSSTLGTYPAAYVSGASYAFSGGSSMLGANPAAYVSGVRTTSNASYFGVLGAGVNVASTSHMASNNRDVIINSAQYERYLDENYVRSIVANIVDVVYDRDATEQELDYLSGRLLREVDNPDDIAQILLNGDGALQGVATNPLYGLSGDALVTQAFLNALGREPSLDELIAWRDNLGSGRISAAQFVASLALSVEHLADGTAHIANTLAPVTTLSGTSGGDTINGTSGDDVLEGLAGADTLSGAYGSDRFIGGAGADTLTDNGGYETYQWSKGDGNDIIDDNGTWLQETDTLVLTDVTSDDVTLARAEGSDDLLITIVSTGEVITDRERFYSTTNGSGLEAISFSDGVVWDLDDILSRTRVEGDSSGNTLHGTGYGDNLFGLAGNDTLNGYDGDDTLEGGLGADTLKGGNGNDSYVWSKGDGNDTIDDSSTSQTDVDRLILTDVASNDVLLKRANGSNHMTVTIVSTGEIITVTNRFGSPDEGKGLELIQFSDGVIWSLSDILGKTQVLGTAAGETLNGKDTDDNLYGLGGNDTLNGNYGNDTFTGGAGDDTLNDYSGEETYLWSKGDGNDTINDDGQWLTETDTLKLLDVTSDDVVLSRANGSDDLLITIVSTGEVITDRERYNATYRGYGVERIVFSDGVIWNLPDILARTKVEGDSGANTLNGTGFSDNIYGFGGADTLNGNDGDDTLVGGQGADTLNGGNGNDRFEWSQGDGNDSLSDTGGSLSDVDSLALMDVDAAGAVLSKSGNNLVVTITSTGEVITVNNRFQSSGSGYGVEVIAFDDGVTTRVLDDPAAIAVTSGTSSANTLNGWGYKDTIYGLEGNDTINGHDGDDTLIGGLGADYIDGGNGSDLYLWSKGDGNDSIDDNAISTTETDTLFLQDVTSDDVVLTRANGSEDLTITIISTGEVIADVDRYLTPSNGSGLEVIKFADGVVWSLSDILERTTLTGTSGADTLNGRDYRDNQYGLAGNDTLNGNNGDDRLEGGLGSDTLKGGNGNDTYVWAKGDGDDTIDDSSTATDQSDVLKLVDVLPGEILLTRVNGSNDLVITVDEGGSSAVLTVKDRFYSNTQGRGIEAIEFSDGTFWTLSDILEKARGEGDGSANTLNGSGYHDNLFGLGGNDTLYGNDGDDVLEGGLGDDSLQGGWGDDVYLYTSGDGNDYILEYHGGTDTIRFTDLVASQLTFNRANGLDLFITDNTTGQTITIDEEFYEARNQIERFEFADGEVWDFGTLLENAWFLGGSGNETIDGTSWTSDVFASSSGDDVLQGDGGNDVYHYRSGDGNDVFNDHHGGTDTVVFEDLNSWQFVNYLAPADHDDALMIDMTTGQTIKLNEEFNGGGDGIEYLLFANGEVWDQSDLYANLWTLGTASAQTLSGTSGSDRLVAFGGDDLVQGGAGDDVYGYSSGDGNDVFFDSGGANDIVRLFDLTAAQVSIGRSFADVDDLIITDNATGQTITLDEQFAGAGNAFERIEFGDGDSWDYATIAANAWFKGTSGSDVLVGTADDDTIAGLGGDDDIQAGDGDDIYVYSSGDGNDTYLDSGGANDKVLFDDLTSSEISISRTFADVDDLILTITATGHIVILDEQFAGGANAFETIEFSDSETWDYATLLANAWFKGTSSADPIVGTSNGETIAGLGGDDDIQAGAGDDVYVYASGDGNDVYLDSAGASDTLRLADLTAAQLGFARSSNDFIITVVSTGETITLTDQFAGTGTAFERIEFADDQVWGVSDIAAHSDIVGTSGDDTLVGAAGSETLIGLGGNDTVQGLGGDDVYEYSAGDGNDVYLDSAGSNDTLRFTDLTSSQLTYARSGNDFVMTVVSTGETITLTDQFAATGATFESIEFSNSEVWGLTEIAVYSDVVGTSGDDTLVGAPGAETLVGLGGNDTIQGLGGDDVYEYSAGDGNDVYLDSAGSMDTLRFLDLDAADLSFVRSGNDLVITVTASSETITLTDQFAGTGTIFEQIEFSNSEVWGVSEINVFSDIVGTSGNDTLAGTSGADTLIGLGGDDNIQGAGGDDVYEYSSGDGNDVYLDSAGSTDTLRFLDLDASELSFAKSGDDFVITVTATSETITLSGQFASTSFERIEFADSEVWGESEIAAFGAIVGTSGNDTLTGTAGADTLIGLGGDDTIQGAGGDDIYVYSSGDGDDVLLDSAGTIDTLRFVDLDAADLSFARVGNNFVITVTATGETVTLSGQYAGNSFERIEFADSEVWGAAEIASYAGIVGTAAGETLTGTSGADTLIAVGGDDTVLGLEGDDVYIYSSGDGNDIFRETSGGNDTVLFSDLTSAQLQFSRSLSDVHDIVITDTTTGQTILLDDVLEYNEAHFETIEFSNGETWDYTTLVEKAWYPGSTGNDTISGTSSNETFYGDAGNDTISGGAGNDTYVYASGDGNDIYVESSGNDTVRFLDLTASQLIFSRSTSNIEDIIITDTTTGQTIKLSNILEWSGRNFETIEFSDSETWDFATLTANAWFRGTSGNDTISGSWHSDVFWGGTGNDTFTGVSGTDIFVFEEANFGNDIITDFTNGADLLDFSALGLDYSDFTVTQSGSHTILTYDDPTYGDQTVQLNYFSSGNLDASDFVVA